jgi:hypothetical protein
MKKASHQLMAMVAAVTMFVGLVSCKSHGGTLSNKPRLVRLLPFELDPKNPGRKQFGALTLLSAFQLQSDDRRFGGLSGLSFGADGKLYAVSDRGHWFSAKLTTAADGKLLDLVDWQIGPMLRAEKTPVNGPFADAEALSRAPDGSFLVAFEGQHRIWRYAAPPATFESVPASIPLPVAMARAPSNGGIECLAALPDGRLLTLTEELANPDGTFKGWLIGAGRTVELAYLPDKGFRVADCAALENGALLVLERRFAWFGIFASRVTIVDGKSVQPGAKLAGRELLRLEQPLGAENYEGLAVQPTSMGTMIYLVSDDNFSSFQQTLLLQFLLPNNHH